MSVESRDQSLVTVSLNHLKDCESSQKKTKKTLVIVHETNARTSTASVSFSTLDDAFGQSSLGILIVKDLPPRFSSLRHQLLSYASYLASLPQHELGIMKYFLPLSQCLFIFISETLYSYHLKSYFHPRRPDT